MMNSRTLDLTFAGLLLATLITWLIGEQGASGPLTVAILLVLAGVKGWWVADEFMALRHVALHWRLIILLWLVIILAVIGFAYYIGMNAVPA